MKVTVITAVRNNAATVEQTVQSVLDQTYQNLEYIVMDGASTDGTLEVLKKYEDKITLISENDKGTRFAMNKAFEMANGDIICTINGDDFYEDKNVLRDVVDLFTKEQVACVYGDMLYVDQNDTNKIIRYWQTGEYKKDAFYKGWFPTWVSFFMKKDVLNHCGLLNTDFTIANDYEFFVRIFMKYRVSSAYMPRVLVRMRAGGLSNASFKKLWLANVESYNAWKVNGLKISPLFLLQKPLSKISQYWKHDFKKS